MKKAILTITGILIILIIACGCSQKQQYISEDKAIEISKTVVKNDEQQQIIDYDNPTAEIITFTKEHYIILNDESGSVDLNGKTAWKITFNTQQDGLLGPIVLYIDSYSSEIYGFDFRE